MSVTEAVTAILEQVKKGAPSIIFLRGNLGAGKTHFVNQVAQAIGVPRRLPSPTFTFLQVYPCDWQNFKKIVHCDFYRIDPAKAEKTLEQIGFWDYVDESNMLFIEWPDQAGSVISGLPHLSLSITLLADGTRTYELT